MLADLVGSDGLALSGAVNPPTLYLVSPRTPNHDAFRAHRQRSPEAADPLFHSNNLYCGLAFRRGSSGPCELTPHDHWEGSRVQ